VSQQRGEGIAGRYYYHNFGGRQYWHYFDSRLNWYGFYLGANFWWFPYYGGYWWWQDAAMSRWLFWYDDYWWWYPYGGEPYIYSNDQYLPYDQYQQQYQTQAQQDSSASDEALPKPPTAPPTAPPSSGAAKAPAQQGSTWVSPDKRRMVQIVGPQAQAYLYDESGLKPTLTKGLAANVESVRFTGGSSGHPLQILLELKGGGFALYDADGNPINGPPQ
jgi:hypothetical protein